MASTTTNYGFDVPTSSDLVKNGATQIALLGQDLDTFLFRPFTRNGVLNSAMNVWQRGTSVATGTTFTYGADRWQTYRSGLVAGSTVSRQATNDTTNLPNIQYCARVQRDSGNTSTGQIVFQQNFETVNSIPYAGKQITFSYYARAGANYSAASSALQGGVVSGTGTDQNLGSAGYTGSATVISTTATLTTTWQRFTGTATVAATATELNINFSYTPIGTAGANDYFEVTGVQLEVGNQASPYAPATSTYALELAACQRYYYQAPSTVIYTPYGVGMFVNATTFQTAVKLPTTMRAIPTLATSNALAAIGTATVALTSISVVNAQSSVDIAYVSGTGSGTSGQPAFLMNNNTTGGYLGLTAEL